MRKLLIYSLLAVGLFGLLGVGIASAQGWFGGFGQATPEEVAQRQEAMFQNKAELLGITLDKVKDAWAEGKSLQEIAEEEGITQEQLQERMEALRQERLEAQLQAMVANGVISQEQANQRLQVMEERSQAMAERFGEKYEEGKPAGGFHRGLGMGFGW